jgi:hypothetical protein
MSDDKKFDQLEKAAERINQVRLKLCGTPIHAEYNKDLTGEIADEEENAMLNSVSDEF